MNFLFLVSKAFSIINVKDFGAIQNKDTVQAQFRNSYAFQAAFIAASNQENQRVVLIPPGKYFAMPFAAQGLTNVTIRIQGKIIASKNTSYWPKMQNNKYVDFFIVRNCRGLKIEGNGKLDGRGYRWWIYVLMVNKKYLPNSGGRPHLMTVTNTSDFEFKDLKLKNSPCYHMKLDDVNNGSIHNIDIRVNTTAQFNLLKQFSVEGVLPMYAFNTDGIDPRGSNLHIYNLTVQNYDDVVVPKPGHIGDIFSPCTQNMLIQNITVRLGVGMSIGSVPPNPKHACIRNITFRNIYFKRPFKAIYIKTNPGNQGDGEIRNILYQNITIQKPIWWPVYIGPQQMREPDGSGPGCLLYPYDPHHTCETQPRITIQNITLIDIKIHRSLLTPITIRCNQSNPCLNINFTRVKADHWRIGKQSGVDCINAQIVQSQNYPKIECTASGDLNQKVDMESQLWGELRQSMRQQTELDQPSQEYNSF